MPRKVRSSRRVAGLKPADYDHEIAIVDYDASTDDLSDCDGGPSDSVRPVQTASTAEAGLLPAADQQPSRLSMQSSLRSDLDNTDSHVQDLPHPAMRPSIEVQAPSPGPLHNDPNVVPDRPKAQRETAIDILYENERGYFFCGRPMFSSRLLGGLDPPTWTNAYHKASPTSIHTSQVPDPTWEWISPEWTINHQENVDEGGWEYAFAFGKAFSFHGPSWYNSFVRRRAWVRKRAKKKPQDVSADPHMLNGDYFTVRPASARSSYMSQKSGGSSRPSSNGTTSRASSINMELANTKIEDLDTLLQMLRSARIDREKLEVARNYLENAHDLERLQHGVHEIMSIFVFQASRRLLLSHLARLYDDTSKKLEDETTPELQERQKALHAALKHADEEVRRLAYWSDVKAMAVSGETGGPADPEHPRDGNWEGLDKSGPVEPNGGKLPGPSGLGTD